MNRKKTFILEENNANPHGMRCIVNIVGSRPECRPYLSITVEKDGNEVYHGWMSDNDLKRFATNILKSLNP